MGCPGSRLPSMKSAKWSRRAFCTRMTGRSSSRGELVPMTPKVNHREALKAHLNVFFARHAGGEWCPCGTHFPPQRNHLSRAGFRLLQKGSRWRSCAETTLADTSTAYDRGRFGIRELWVIYASAACAPSPTAPAVRLAVKDSFAAPSVNLKLVNESAADLFPVRFTLC